MAETDLVLCTARYVVAVAKAAKCRFAPQETSPYTVEIVLPAEQRRRDQVMDMQRAMMDRNEQNHERSPAR